MCRCDPRVRTPFCGRGDCQEPVPIGARPSETKAERVERLARKLCSRYIQADGSGTEFVGAIFIPKRWETESYTRKLWFELREALASEDV
jgi:hypothetical protein